jgi:hypothetical protein
VSIRDEFEAEWERQTHLLKANMDAILRERMEAWCAEKNLTAEIDIEIDWDCHVQVHKLEPAGKDQP